MGRRDSHTFQSTLTDLMTSLAVIFILLLVVFLKQAHDQGKNTKTELEKRLSSLLESQNLAVRADAEDPLSLQVQVGEDKLRFSLGSAALSADAQQFVGGFFKEFSHRICSPEVMNKIDSVVIEGHTDRSGEKTAEGVNRNIALSQRRSFAVLEQALSSLSNEAGSYECLLKLTSANGRGSRAPVFDSNGQYSADLSRRVQIRIRVKSAEQKASSLGTLPAAPADAEKSADSK